MQAAYQPPIFLAFGMTGAGKSYFLNLLEGFEEPWSDKCPYLSVTSNKSATKVPLIRQPKLQNASNWEVVLIDMPGMMDTSNAYQDSDDISKDQEAIEKVEQYVEHRLGEYKYNNVLLVIAPGRAGEELVKTLEIARLIFEPARIIPCFSRCVTKRSRSEAEKMYKDYCSNTFYNNYGWNFNDMAGPIYIGETPEDEAQELLRHHHSFPAQPKRMSYLTKSEVEYIAERIKYFKAKGLKCFPGDSLLHTSYGGQVKMSEVTRMQPIISWTGQKDGKYQIHKDNVLTWLHIEPDLWSEFVLLKVNESEFLELSKKHLVYTTGKNDQTGSFKFADSVCVGDYLHRIDGTMAQVSQVSTRFSKGVYAPLTQKGTLIVNGFKVSSYAHVDHNIYDLAMAPLKLYAKLGLQDTSVIGIHPYTKKVIEAAEFAGVNLPI